MDVGQRHGGLGQVGAVEAGLAVDMLGGDEVAAEGAVAAGEDGNIGAPGQFADHAGVARGELERHVAGDAGEAQQLDLVRAGQCQKDGDGVVLPRVGVDDDLARGHGVAVSRSGRFVYWEMQTGRTPALLLAGNIPGVWGQRPQRSPFSAPVPSCPVRSPQGSSGPCGLRRSRGSSGWTGCGASIFRARG